jgi:hypothetical protein
MKLCVACVFAGFLSLVLSMAGGTSNAHLKATSTNGSVAGMQMKGTGNVPVTVKPESLMFSEQLVGTRSAGKMVNFTDDGSMDVHFTNIFLEGVNANQFSFTSTCGVNGDALAPGERCRRRLRGPTIRRQLRAAGSVDQRDWNGRGSSAQGIDLPENDGR